MRVWEQSGGWQRDGWQRSGEGFSGRFFGLEVVLDYALMNVSNLLILILHCIVG